MTQRRKSPLQLENVEPQMCTIDLRLKILSGLPFFADLSEAEIVGINKLFRERGYAPSETIYFAGDEARNLYVVASGQVKLIRHTLTGQDVLLDILTRGEFFGSLTTLGDDTYSDTAQAQSAVCLLTVNAADFRAILTAFPAVAISVLDIVASRLRAAHEMVRQLSAYSVEKRIAYTLLKLGEKLGDPQKIGLLIQMPLSRDDLAGMIGTTTETASRIMSQFQKDGLIQSGRQWVAITDRPGLTAVAGDDD